MMRKAALLIVAATAIASVACVPSVLAADRPPERDARYFEKLDNGAVRCVLCPNFCTIGEGQRGFCRVRVNRSGRLKTLVYGTPCAVHVDPIEKKPFFHVLPGSLSFSIATAGCNMRCVFCQNWQISQAAPEEVAVYNLPPERVVDEAVRNNCATIAFTYTEPTIFYEYMLDIARAAQARGVKCVMHTCGYINPEPLKELAQYLYAVDVDLKGFDEAFYRKMGQGHLQPVLETLKILHDEGVWLEITNLVIPGENDDPKLIRRMSQWIRDNLGEEVPLHLSRFSPSFKLQNLPPTPAETLEFARDIAMETGLKYVYIGNVPNNPGESTYCPRCKKNVLKRIGYTVAENNIVNGKCRFCGYEIRGRWDGR